jgi:hypothetical protein
LQAFDIRSQQHKRGVLTTQKITKHVSIVGIARGLFENTKLRGKEKFRVWWIHLIIIFKNYRNN